MYIISGSHIIIIVLCVLKMETCLTPRFKMFELRRGDSKYVFKMANYVYYMHIDKKIASCVNHHGGEKSNYFRTSHPWKH